MSVSFNKSRLVHLSKRFSDHIKDQSKSHMKNQNTNFSDYVKSYFFKGDKVNYSEKTFQFNKNKYSYEEIKDLVTYVYPSSSRFTRFENAIIAAFGGLAVYKSVENAYKLNEYFPKYKEEEFDAKKALSDYKDLANKFEIKYEVERKKAEESEAELKAIKDTYVYKAASKINLI